MIGYFPHHLFHIKEYMIAMLKFDEKRIIVVWYYINNPAYFNHSLMACYCLKALPNQIIGGIF